MDKQKMLKQEAEEILRRLKLFPLLRKYGETHLVGSVVLELIVKLDLDIHLLLSSGSLMESVNQIATELLDSPEIREIRISDYRPKGVKIGIDECLAPSGNWTIDIWLTTDRATTAFDHTKRILSQLTSEKRRIILALKEHYHQRGKLRDGISSIIYKAVLNGVRNVEEFEGSSLYLEYVQSN